MFEVVDDDLGSWVVLRGLERVVKSSWTDDAHEFAILEHLSFVVTIAVKNIGE